MTVYCLSSSAYANQPLALEWLGERCNVRQVLSRWRTPQGTGFRVLTEDGQKFELFYDETRDEWSIETLP